jgi:hypothetical protein
LFFFFRGEVPLYYTWARSAFFGHVPHVVIMCSGKEMALSNTRPIVAVVQDKETFRYWLF